MILQGISLQCSMLLMLLLLAVLSDDLKIIGCENSSFLINAMEDFHNICALIHTFKIQPHTEIIYTKSAHSQQYALSFHQYPNNI